MRMRWQEACWPRPLEQARRTTHALVFWVARVVSRRTHATDNFNFVRPASKHQYVEPPCTALPGWNLYELFE